LLLKKKDLEKLDDLVDLLRNNKPLDKKYKNHKLKGSYKDYWECHIEPDWLLIYKKTTKEIILARTGTHSDLFK
jgi:mRNA interferase YafQ